jgi:hypothetical protein
LFVTDQLVAHCHGCLFTIVFENLIGNAGKFMSNRSHARIEVGATAEHAHTYFVRDNGAGFDMSYGAKLFSAPVFGDGIRGYRHRTRDHAADHLPAWRANMGRRRTRLRSNVLLYP